LTDQSVRYLRFDVDNPYVSKVKSYGAFRISFRDKDYLGYIGDLLDILDSYRQKGTFFFRPRYTLPIRALAESILAKGHEIGHHVDKTRGIDKMREEKMILEGVAGVVDGITIHGRGIPLLSPSGDGCHEKYLSYCIELGYTYEGTGLRNKFEKLDGLTILPTHTTLDRYSKPDIPELIMLVHPCRVFRNRMMREVFEETLTRYRFLPLKAAVELESGRQF